MSSKFFIFAIFFFQFISIWCRHIGGQEGIYRPNVTGFIPIATISRTTSLYATDINMSLAVYQRPVNDPHKQTLRVLNVSTNLDATNRCIGYGFSLTFWGHYPTINSQATGNGGCDAILGSECSQSIHNLLQQSVVDISSTACEVPDRYILHYPPKGCSPPIDGHEDLDTEIFLQDGESISGPALFSERRTLSNNSDYDDRLKKFAFVFFVGRSYSSGKIDSAIACFSIYNTTA